MRAELHQVGHGTPGVKEKMAHLRRLVEQSKRDPGFRGLALRIVRDVPEGDTAGELAAVSQWVRRNVKYRRDPHGVELFVAPDLLAQQALAGMATAAGDCDDHVAIGTALAEVLGHPSRFVVGGTPRPGRDVTWHHIWRQSFDNKAGRWRDFDDTAKKRPPGWSPAARFDATLPEPRGLSAMPRQRVGLPCFDGNGRVIPGVAQLCAVPSPFATIDGLGGFGKKLKKLRKKAVKVTKKVVKKALPIAAIAVNVVPGIGQVASVALTAAAAMQKQQQAKKRQQQALSNAAIDQAAADKAYSDEVARVAAENERSFQLAQAQAAAAVPPSSPLPMPMPIVGGSPYHQASGGMLVQAPQPQYQYPPPSPQQYQPMPAYYPQAPESFYGDDWGVPSYPPFDPPPEVFYESWPDYSSASLGALKAIRARHRSPAMRARVAMPKRGGGRRITVETKRVGLPLTDLRRRPLNLARAKHLRASGLGGIFDFFSSPGFSSFAGQAASLIGQAATTGQVSIGGYNVPLGRDAMRLVSGVQRMAPMVNPALRLVGSSVQLAPAGPPPSRVYAPLPAPPAPMLPPPPPMQPMILPPQSRAQAFAAAARAGMVATPQFPRRGGVNMPMLLGIGAAAVAGLLLLRGRR